MWAQIKLPTFNRFCLLNYLKLLDNINTTHYHKNTKNQKQSSTKPEHETFSVIILFQWQNRFRKLIHIQRTCISTHVKAPTKHIMRASKNTG
ncbi:hypothetical protein HanRHA438_Chr08g0344771 [Helianthus annuus]|nr:hypothetical protein HanRHA438_Chr08g0344771 [Helianthus annuus]